ncbi:MAG: hypothetical protein KDB82_04360 [Planctomycetes bacterium]|nr:hypothetical protein [Planctomycetota bacterium]
MKRMLFTGALALVLGLGLISPVTADKTESKGEAAPVADKVPAPTEFKINDGKLEGHKRPNDVLVKAIKAAKAGEADTLKVCFNPNNRDGLDQASWGEKDGDNELTNLQAMTRVLKSYPDAGGLEMKQGKDGNYATVAVKNGDAVNLVQVQRLKKWEDEEGNESWYLTSYMASSYRIDYNAPGLKEIRDAIDSGDIEKMKEHLDIWQTPALDLITGVEEGVDGYALLMKRFQKIGKTAEKPIILKRNGMSSLAYWFHSETADTFLVLQFNEQTDWNTNKKYTNVTISISDTAEFQKDPLGYFKSWVGDWSY